MEQELKDYTALDINEFLVADTSVLRIYEQTDALAVDQMFEGIPGGNIIFGGMQIRKKSYNDTVTSGVWLGVDSDGIGKINIGDNDDFLLWNGSALVISGSITATSGTIGGWTIGSDTLTGGGITLDSDGIIDVDGGIIRTDSSGQRIVISGSTNSILVYDNGGTRRVEIDQDEIIWFNSSGAERGGITAGTTELIMEALTGGNLQLRANGSLNAVVMIAGGDQIGAFTLSGLGMQKDITMNGNDINMDGGEINNIDEMTFVKTTRRPNADGEILHFDNGSTESMRVQMDGTDYTFDLSFL